MSNFLPRVTRLVATQSILFVCDIQELFRPLIFRSLTVIDRTSLVTKVSRTLDIPIVVTRQYPKVFGETCTEIQSEILKYGDKSMVTDVAKTQFSMMTSEVKEACQKFAERDKIIMCGIEAHVCLMQTALDLLETGKEVHVVCDAASSQRAHDRTVAMKRLESAGCIMTTSESVIFDLLRDSKHPQFKAISSMIKEHSAFQNEFADSERL